MAKQPNNNLILALTCSTHGVHDGISVAMNLILPQLAQVFGLSYAQVGMLRAVKSAAMVACEIPAGIMAERLGERRLLVFGLVAAGFGALLLAVSGSLGLVILAFIIIGIGNAFQHSLSSSIISTNFGPATKRAALGLYNSAGDAGKLGFTGLIALSAGIGLAWQGMVLFFAISCLGLAALLWVSFASRDIGSPQPLAAIARQKGWGIRDKRGFVSLCLTTLIDTAVQSGFMVFLVFVMVEKGMALPLSGLALVLTLIGGMFGKAGCGYLAQIIGPRAAFALAQIATALGILILLATPAFGAFIVLPILGMFLQGTTSITYGTVTDMIDADKQSRGFAMLYSFSGLAAVVGPIIFGMVSDAMGLNIAMGVMAGVALLAIIPSLFLKT